MSYRAPATPAECLKIVNVQFAAHYTKFEVKYI